MHTRTQINIRLLGESAQGNSPRHKLRHKRQVRIRKCGPKHIVCLTSSACGARTAPAGPLRPDGTQGPPGDPGGSRATPHSLPRRNRRTPPAQPAAPAPAGAAAARAVAWRRGPRAAAGGPQPAPPKDAPRGPRPPRGASGRPRGSPRRRRARGPRRRLGCARGTWEGQPERRLPRGSGWVAVERPPRGSLGHLPPKLADRARNRTNIADASASTSEETDSRPPPRVRFALSNFDRSRTKLVRFRATLGRNWTISGQLPPKSCQIWCQVGAKLCRSRANLADVDRIRPNVGRNRPDFGDSGPKAAGVGRRCPNCGRIWGPIAAGFGPMPATIHADRMAPSFVQTLGAYFEAIFRTTRWTAGRCPAPRTSASNKHGPELPPPPKSSQGGKACADPAEVDQGERRHASANCWAANFGADRVVGGLGRRLSELHQIRARFERE